jgi:hypothetical protein
MNSLKLNSNTEVDYTPEREMHLLKEEEVAADQNEYLKLNIIYYLVCDQYATLSLLRQKK